MSDVRLADLAAGQWLTIESRSVATGLLEPQTARRLGEALSSREFLTAEKIGPGDPPRTPVTDFPEQLEQWANRANGKKVADLNVARSSAPHMNGRVLLHRDPLGRGRRFASIVELGYGAEWFAEDDTRLEPLVGLLERVVAETRAFYAFIEFSLLSWQRREFWSRASRARGHEQSPYAGTPKIERHLEDVHWVQYFGPAFVDRWGAARFRQLGVRRESTNGGGVIVWATPRPWHFQADAVSIRDYAWKDPFYDALPDNTLWHEDFAEAAPGELLPTLDEHRDRS